MRSWRRTALIVGVLAGIGPVLHAQAQDDAVRWSATSSSPKVKPGGSVQVTVSMIASEGWHVYALTQEPPPVATRITVPGGQPYVLSGEIGTPLAESTFDPSFGIDTEYYAGNGAFELPIAVSATARAGKAPLRVQVRYQSCNDQFCFPPQTVTMTVALEITGPGAAAGTAVAPVRASNEPARPLDLWAGAQAASRPGAGSPGKPARSDSLWSFVWLAMTVGALSLLTPCVFPMVPITVSYFTSHAAGSRRKAVQQALIYAIGIILTFTALGMAMALLVGATSLNRFAASPWVNILITGIFLAFAGSLFGLFDLRLPSGLVTRLDSMTRREGGSQTIATLLMGLTFTLTSFTCTAPFIGTLLVMAAGGDWQWPLIGMLAFSTVFAFPFFILALMPQWMAGLPRSGGWLNSVKVLMAFLEVAAAMKFISNVDLVWHWGVFTRDVVLASWVVLFVMMALYTLGLFRFAHDSDVKRVGAGRLVTSLVCGTVGLWLLTGLAGKQLGEIEAFLPPAQPSAHLAAGSGVDEPVWVLNDYDAALAQATREGKPVFIDFTGYTCTNCRWMESNMFPREDVRQALSRFVLVRLYTDGDGEMFERQQRMQQARYQTVALPFYAIVGAGGEPISTFPGLTRDPAQFVSFLNRGAGSARQPGHLIP